MKKCQAICPSAAYQRHRVEQGLICRNRATVRFKDGVELCGQHASKRLLADSIKSGEVEAIRMEYAVPIAAGVTLQKRRKVT